MIFAFLAYGGLVIALTTTIAAIVPREQVYEVSGLYQIAVQVGPSWMAVGVITAFALALVQLNSASWLWGMSRLIYTSGRAGGMPRWFVQLDGRDLPRRAIGVLATTFMVLTIIGAVVPGLVVDAITLASSVFMFLYLLCLASYWRIERGFSKRLLCSGLAIFLLATLASVGPKILYPISVFIIAMLVSIIRGRRSASR